VQTNLRQVFYGYACGERFHILGRRREGKWFESCDMKKVEAEV